MNYANLFIIFLIIFLFNITKEDVDVKLYIFKSFEFIYSIQIQNLKLQ